MHTPGERIRFLLRFFGLTPSRVNRDSAGRFGRWAVKSWIEDGREPSAPKALAFMDFLAEKNRELARSGQPSLASKFLTVQWVWGPTDNQDDSHGPNMRPRPPAAQPEAQEAAS